MTQGNPDPPPDLCSPAAPWSRPRSAWDLLLRLSGQETQASALPGHIPFPLGPGTHEPYLPVRQDPAADKRPEAGHGRRADGCGRPPGMPLQVGDEDVLDQGKIKFLKTLSLFPDDPWPP